MGKSLIKFQGAGETSEECFAFAKEFYKSIFPPNDAISSYPYDLRHNRARIWECFSVVWNLSCINAGFKGTDTVLEFGAWPSFASVHFSKFVETMVVSDSFDWLKKREDFREYEPYGWTSEVRKYNMSNLTVEEADIQETSYPDKTFDKVISFGVFEHVKDDKKALHEIARILKDDGVCAMTVDFKYGQALPYRDDKLERIYNKELLLSLVEDSPLTFAFEPFDDWWESHECEHIVAISIALRKK